MSITTEDALRMAGGCDIDNFPIRAAAIRSLAAERDALKAENARLRAVLEKLARLGAEPHYGNSVGNIIARAALGEKE
jgi:hypothetical protein